MTIEFGKAAAGLASGLAIALASLGVIGSTATTAGFGDERRVALYNIHNEETIDIVYWRDGKRIPSAMEKLNWFLRDWREDEPTKMDPELIDILWEIRTELGTREPTHLISGYRSSKTNAMLRRTRGGQAKKSRHMLGSAMDIHFPDVSMKKVRYSALVRERGGVGYYPTSALPFVHIDTGRTRHWPRMPRYELALLFPNGKTKHVPSSGGRITKRDVNIARSKHKKLAQQIAAFHDFRSQPKAPQPTLVASGWGASVTRDTPVSQSFRKVAQADEAKIGSSSRMGEFRVASLGGLVPPAPQPVLRPGLHRADSENNPPAASSPAPTATSDAARPEPPKAEPQPSGSMLSSLDRMRLSDLIDLTALLPTFSRTPAPAAVESESREPSAIAADTGMPAAGETELANGSLEDSARAARLGVSGLDRRLPEGAVAAADLDGWSNGFAAAPAFDPEHPEELLYRPFPIGPLMSETAKSEAPMLVAFSALDANATLEMLDEEPVLLPMRLTAPEKVAQAMLTQEFTGRAITPLAASDRTVAETDDEGAAPADRLARRTVRTSLR